MGLNNFNQAIQIVLKNEGGYVDNKNDPGAATNYGISQRSYPNLNIAQITQQQAINIYLNDFWMPNNYGSINDLNLATKVFDFGVNAGPLTSNKYLQVAYNAYPNIQTPLIIDGDLGPVSCAAINKVDPLILLGIFKTHIAQYYEQLANNNNQYAGFLIGWLRRAYA